MWERRVALMLALVKPLGISVKMPACGGGGAGVVTGKMRGKSAGATVLVMDKMRAENCRLAKYVTL